jgi:hypothetical protein
MPINPANAMWLALSVALLLLGGWRAAACRSSLRWIAAQEIPPLLPGETPAVCLIVPLLREQDNLPELLERFSRLEYPPGRLRVVLVTSRRERIERKAQRAKLDQLVDDLLARVSLQCLLRRHLGTLPRSSLMALLAKSASEPTVELLRGAVREEFQRVPLTVELVRRLIPPLNDSIGDERFISLEMSSTDGWMAHQVNYAAHRTGAMLGDPAQTYIGLYTADAMPSIHLMACLSWTAIAARERFGGWPPVLQQCASFTRNIGEHSDTLEGDMLRAAGILQTAFHLSTEVPAWRKLIRMQEQSRGWGWQRALMGLRRPYAPVVGHGLFVRADLFAQHDGLPTAFWCEDIALTFLYHLRGVPIMPLPSFEENETPYTLRACRDQACTWFSTLIMLRSLLQFARTYGEPTPGLAAGLYARRALRNTEWLLGGPCCLLLPFLGALQHPLIGAASALLTAGYVFLPSIAVFVSRQTPVSGTNRPLKTARLVVATWIYTCIVAPGGPWQALLFRFLRRGGEKGKTER